MLLSLALIIMLSLLLVSIFQKLKIPGIVAMIFTGMILGPYALDLISPDILTIAPDLKQIAFVVILLRAGLTVDIKDLKKVGRPAILLSFLPSVIEIIAIALIAPLFFDISLLESFILGSVVAAVSPAVVVPRMISLIENKQGTEKSIPQMILAGSSIDGIFVIIVFSSLMQIYQSGSYSWIGFIQLPIAIIFGLIAGILIGIFLSFIFKKIHMRDTLKVLIIFSFSFFVIYLENLLKPYVPFSSLLAVMAIGGTILKSYPILANRLTFKFSKIWVGAEIMLFVLVGAIVDVSILKNVGFTALIVIICALIFRMLATFLSTANTHLNTKERLFTAFSYTPKATVQAAIGAIPLSLGVTSGNLILTIAVLAIIITAPLGAFLIDYFASRFLTVSSDIQ